MLCMGTTTRSFVRLLVSFQSVQYMENVFDYIFMVWRVFWTFVYWDVKCITRWIITSGMDNTCFCCKKIEERWKSVALTVVAPKRISYGIKYTLYYVHTFVLNISSKMLVIFFFLLLVLCRSHFGTCKLSG